MSAGNVSTPRIRMLMSIAVLPVLIICLDEISVEAATLDNVIGAYEFLFSESGLTCAKSVHLLDTADNYIEHSAITKNGAACGDVSTGGIRIEEWPLVASKLQLQIQSQPVADSDKRAGHEDVVDSYDAILARGQDTVAYICGGIGSGGDFRDVYTFIKNISNPWLAEKLQTMGAARVFEGHGSDNVHLQIWTPERSFDALSPTQQGNQILVLPLGGCWYRQVAAEAGTDAQLQNTTSPATTKVETTTQSHESTNHAVVTKDADYTSGHAVAMPGLKPFASPSIADNSTSNSSGEARESPMDATDSEDSTSAASELQPGSRGCFPADATVLLASGKPRRMDSLRVGDRVLVGSGMFSTVFMFTHRNERGRDVFIRIQTSSGASIMLTHGHYIYVNDGLQPASKVMVGDTLYLATGIRQIVVSTECISGNFGLYNPQTIHGDIVVDGIRASTYTTAVLPEVAHAMLHPVRKSYVFCCFLHTLWKPLSISSLEVFKNTLPSMMAESGNE